MTGTQNANPAPEPVSDAAPVTAKPEKTVLIVVGQPPLGFPVHEPGAIARVTATAAKALLKSGAAVREATQRDQGLYGRPPVDARAWAPPAAKAK